MECCRSRYRSLDRSLSSQPIGSTDHFPMESGKIVQYCMPVDQPDIQLNIRPAG